MKKNTLSLLFVGAVIMMIGACNSGNKPTNNDSNTDKVKTNVVSQEYEFGKQITITGTVYEIPNSGSTEMKSYVLALVSPIALISKNKDIESQSDVQEVQIGFDDETIDPANFVDKKITITGTINASETMHDKRPVVMFDAKITK